MMGKAVWVSCDHPDCDQEVSLTGQVTVRKVQTAARRDGWQIDAAPDGGDFCPAHRLPRGRMS